MKTGIGYFVGEKQAGNPLIPSNYLETAARIAEKLDATVYGPVNFGGNPILVEMKIDLASDEWGQSMHFWFAVAGEMNYRGLDIPPEWHFKPGANDGREPESAGYEVCSEATDEQLQHAGRILCRYTRMLQYCGKDY